MNNTGIRIGELRRAHGMTQEQLGAKLGVSGQAVSKWETGESLPDITLLPSLCEALEISADSLLGIETRKAVSQPLENFIQWAKEHGRGRALLDALVRLTSGLGPRADINTNIINIGANYLRVHLKEGVGFILCDGGYSYLASADAEKAAFYLCPLGSEKVLRVLSHTSPSAAVTESELCGFAGIAEEECDAILLALMQRNILFCGTDADGKRGYMQSAGMCGVFMALAGAIAQDADNIGMSFISNEIE